MPIETTKRYLRINVSSEPYAKIRTHDIGRKGHSKRLAMLSKKTGRWKTRTWLISIQDLRKRDPKTQKLLDTIAKKLPRRDKQILRQKLSKLI